MCGGYKTSNAVDLGFGVCTSKQILRMHFASHKSLNAISQPCMKAWRHLQNYVQRQKRKKEAHSYCTFEPFKHRHTTKTKLTEKKESKN